MQITIDKELTQDEMLAYWVFQGHLDEGCSIPKAVRITRAVFEALDTPLTDDFWAWLAR